MQFTFKARDAEGKVIRGKVEAMNTNEAAALLQRQSLVPVTISDIAEESPFMMELRRLWEGITQTELVVFFRQLSALIEAKVPVLLSLRTIQRQVENRYFKAVLKGVGDDVEDGLPLSEALAKYPLVFDTLTVSMIRAGEVSGSLHKSIVHLAENIEKTYDLTAKIRGALYYPGFVILAAGVIGFLTLTYIVPKITGIISEMQIKIPWYTKLVIKVGDLMQNYWWAVLIVLFAGFGSAMYYFRTPNGAKEWDIVKLRLPVLGDLFRFLYIARFAENLSALLISGIPLVKSLLIVSSVVGNSVYESIILRSADEVKKGGTISSVLIRDENIPPIVTQMVEIGEESGQLSETLKNTAAFYSREVDNRARTLATMIEPILIVILGIGVAILVFAILVPIYDIVGKM